MLGTCYQEHLLHELAQSRYNDFSDNFDNLQLGEEPPSPLTLLEVAMAHVRENLSSAKTLTAQFRSLLPLTKVATHYFLPKRYYHSAATEQVAQGKYLYELLADDASKQLLIKLMAYRILGHRKVKLPRNCPKYWQDINLAVSTRSSEAPLPIKFMDTELAFYSLKSFGFDIDLYASGPGIACTYLQKQYEYHNDTVHCKVEPGDIAIDAGSCWGDTTLYLAHEAGPRGKVVAFEFIPSNFAVLKRNIDRNPHLHDRIVFIENPIWSHSDLKLYYVDWGPGSRVTTDINKYHSWEGMTTTVTLDETVNKLGLPKIDFIKMDIEGAELEALRGGESSIRKYRPKIAVSLYHNPEDFDTIPRYLNELDIGYKFYLEHHTIYQNETVLFAVP